MTEDNKKRYKFVSPVDNEEHVVTAKQPRQAALKAATMMPADGTEYVIVLTEKNRVRAKRRNFQYRISCSMQAKPAKAPNWLPDQIRVGKAKSLGVIKGD